MLRRCLRIAMLGLLPWLAGCFTVWGAPEWISYPEATLPPTEDEVLAVNVDILRKKTPGPLPLAGTDEYRFEVVEPVAGQIPKQGKLTFSYRYWVAYGAAGVSGSQKHFALTKLYRRGYQTIVIRPGFSPGTVEWQPALRPDEQALALDQFIRGTWDRLPPPVAVSSTPKGLVLPRSHLAAGSAGEGHRSVLLYAAAEYDHVAGHYPAGSAGEKQCRQEAEALRRRAAE